PAPFPPVSTQRRFLRSPAGGSAAKFGYPLAAVPVSRDEFAVEEIAQLAVPGLAVDALQQPRMGGRSLVADAAEVGHALGEDGGLGLLQLCENIVRLHLRAGQGLHGKARKAGA